ncbi:MAG: VOC family protein [Promethearchaeota archaeon]
MNEIKLIKFNQIGILVKDIKKSKRFFENLLGLDKELQIVEQQSTARY